MRSRTLVIIGAAASIAAMGCYPDLFISEPQELASVVTVVDSQTPLKTARTFALPDTVLHVKVDGDSTTIGHDGDAQILQRIREGFIGMGWQEITDVTTTRPDVVILTAVLERTQTGVAYAGWWGDWGYWGGWPAGYGPTWGWGYPTAIEFEYDTGTLAITMLDLRAGDPTTQQVPLLWAAGVNGVLATSSLEGALNGITQAFVQSPYLDRP